MVATLEGLMLERFRATHPEAAERAAALEP